MKKMKAFPTAFFCFVLFVLAGCSNAPDYLVDSLEITSVARSFPDRDDWLHVVEGKVSVRFAQPPTVELLEEVRTELGIALYVYTKGNPNPMYFFQYVSGEPNTSRIAYPYVFEPARPENIYNAKWELTDIYLGDEEFNDLSYEAVALAADREVLERLVDFMSLKSLLNLPNELGARLVFSEPIGVERETSAPPEDSVPAAEEEPTE